MRRCVDYVNCLSSVDWHGCRGVYSISCLIDGASADFVGFLGRCLISPGKACGCFAPARSRVFSFLRDGGGDFLSTPFPQYILGGCLLACSPIAIECDKCVASPCSDINTGLLFIFRPTPFPRLFPICLLDVFPRPRAWDVRAGYLICGCGHCCGLPACFIPISLSRSRSFAIAVRPVIFLVGLFLACGRMWRCWVLRPACLVD